MSDPTKSSGTLIKLQRVGISKTPCNIAAASSCCGWRFLKSFHTVVTHRSPLHKILRSFENHAWSHFFGVFFAWFWIQNQAKNTPKKWLQAWFSKERRILCRGDLWVTTVWNDFKNLQPQQLEAAAILQGVLDIPTLCSLINVPELFVGSDMAISHLFLVSKIFNFMKILNYLLSKSKVPKM